MYANPGYNAVITDMASNPLALRPAYSQQSPAWPNFNTVTLDMGTQLAGETVVALVRSRELREAAG